MVRNIAAFCITVGLAGYPVAESFADPNAFAQSVSPNSQVEIGSAPGVWEGFGSTVRGCSGWVRNLLTHDGQVYVFSSGSCGEQQGGSGAIAGRIYTFDPESNEFGPRIEIPNISGGDGAVGPAVTTATFFQGNLYIGGLFTSIDGEIVNNIAYWDGENWHALGEGENAGVTVDESRTSVRALYADEDHLYVGGRFAQAGSIPAGSIARWDGESWSSIGDFWNVEWDGSARINAITRFQNDLIVAGWFDQVNELEANHIARWNGTDWSSLGHGDANGIGGSVNTLFPYGNQLYVGGDLFQAGGQPARRIAIWDGEWNPIVVTDEFGTEHNGMPGGVVAAITAFEDKIVVGGTFFTAGYTPVRRIAAWTGSEWLDLDHGIERFPNSTISLRVDALLPMGDRLLVGGSFQYAGEPLAENVAQNIAAWNGESWIHNLGAGKTQGIGTRDIFSFHSDGGVTGGVSASARSGGDHFFVGNFFRAGKLPTGHMARHTGNEWIDPDFDPLVEYRTVFTRLRSIHVAESEVVVGFERDIPYQDERFNSIAVWDGDTWVGLGPADSNGVTGRTTINDRTNVSTLLEAEAGLYVGGNFNRAGDVDANSIALWNGTDWESLGEGEANGVQGQVNAAVFFEGDLIVAGTIWKAGDQSVKGIARWDGNTWHDFSSSEIEGVFEGLEVSGGRLFAAGEFILSDGGQSWAELIAVHDGQSWSPLGPASAELAQYWNRVTALEILGNQVYAGRSSQNPSQSDPFNAVAFWDGFEWRRLGTGEYAGVAGRGTGFLPVVRVLDLSSDGLIVAGRFLTADEQLSRNIARFIPTVDLDVRVSAEIPESTSEFDISAQRSSDSFSILITIENRGTGGVRDAEVLFNWSPEPAEIYWVCVADQQSGTECPAEAGIGSPGPLLDLPAGSSLTFEVTIIPSSSAMLQNLAVSVDASNTSGAVGNTSDELLLEFPVTEIIIFQNRFE